jgi:hypothetical protein
MPPPNSVSGANNAAPAAGASVNPSSVGYTAVNGAQVCPADGLHGRLGLYEVKHDGKTEYMTRQQLDQSAFGRPADGQAVVRHDNHRELARDAVSNTLHQSVTDEKLDSLFSVLTPSANNPLGWLSGADKSVQQAFDAQVAAFGRTTTEVWNFKPPGWEQANGNPAACFRLANEGAQQTAARGDSAVGGGGVVLYEKVAQRITTDADASRLAVAQIRSHIDAGKAVVAGVNEPGHSSVVDAKRQPVTDHFVAIYGYETDAQGQVTALLARDNAVSGTAAVRFEVKADGSITKPAEPKRAEDYLRQEYQLSEVRFHTSLPYGGDLAPTNDAGQSMAWKPKG